MIRNSGSTNTQAYTIAVRPDGSADVTVGAVTQHRQIEHSQTAWLFAKLEGAVPLAALPAPHCMRSASFGTTTTISYHGERTPDLSCGEDQVVKELARTARAIVDRLGISVMRRRTLPE